MGYIDLPTLNIDFLKPSRMSFDVKGGGLEGGRNGLDESISIETTGGGALVGSYQNCFVQAPEAHEYANWVAARMGGSFRFMNVPILSDWMGPFPVNSRNIPQPIIRRIPHSDKALFADGAGYSQTTVFGTIPVAAALNAGRIWVNVYGASRKLRWSDWFSIFHPTKGHRAYRYWEVLSPRPVAEVIDGVYRTGTQYLLSLDRPLRQAVPAGIRVEFARPLCVMKFPSGFTLPWEVEGFWESSPTIQFVEGF